MSQYDVVIIGAGCVGAFTAFYLSQYKTKVLVLEKCVEAGMGTTKANSGIVHAGHNTTPGTVKAQLVDQGNAIIQELSQKLNFGFKQCGELVVAKSEEEYPKLNEMYKYAVSQQIPIEEWDEDKIRKEEPNLNTSIKKALFAPTAGVINPYEMVCALMYCNERNGVQTIYSQEVTSIQFNNGEYQIKTQDNSFTSKYVVNAAGLYADVIAKMVNKDSPIQIKPRKGEEFLLDKDFGGLVKRIIFPLPTGVSKGTLIIPTVDSTIMVGPTADETNDKNDFSTTENGMQRVFEAAKQLIPSINPSMVISSFAGIRAADVTQDFVINIENGFVNAAGIQSPGLTASPAIALKIVEMINSSKTFQRNNEFVVHPLGVKFRIQTPAQKKLLVEADANHSKIICACEMVTEADAHQAITEGARTLDGVKIRTRAGMGRCQGGFCTSRIIEILADRMDVPQSDISKRGVETVINIGEIGQLETQHHPCNGNTPITMYNPVKLSETTPRIMTTNESALKEIVSSQQADILIVGAGPAGLAAGISAAKRNPQLKVVILERLERSGGILLQCIHSGFGLKRYKQELTGPEYSEILTDEAVTSGVHIVLNAFVVDVCFDNGKYTVNAVVSGLGMVQFKSLALVTAVGCRERTRFGVRIQGTRPSGVYTAGLAQAMINLQGQIPGKRIVILGSGDIGLIMARRCTLEGASVLGVYELLPRCSGLQRNVAQCLQDYGIPLHLSKTVVEIRGRDRVEQVVVAEVDPTTLVPNLAKTEVLDCDCLLLSVGLLPQTKMSVQAGGKLHQRTRNPIVDSYRQAAPGLYVVGNCLQVHDLADDAAEEGDAAGYVAAGTIASSEKTTSPLIEVTHSKDVLFAVPQMLYATKDPLTKQKIQTRCAVPFGKITLKAEYNGVEIGVEAVEDAVPAEAIHVNIDSKLLCELYEKDKTKTVELKIQVEKQEKTVSSNAHALTCIVCPRGCRLRVTMNDNGDIESITGNGCQKGERYARQEFTEPMRVFSTTVSISGSSVLQRLPVKLSKPVPRSRLIEVANFIKTLKAEKGVNRGDVIAANILGLCDVIACCSAPE